jgi:hypothetical protein
MKEDSDPNHPDVVPYPMMPLRDIVIYPFTMFPIGTRTPSYIRALEEALASDQKIFVTALRDPNIDEPTLEQIYQVGTICTILRPKRSEGVIKVILSGQERALAEQIENRNGFLTAYLRPAPSLVKEDEAAVNTLIQRATKFVEQLHQMRQHVYALDLSYVTHITDPLQLADIAALQMFKEFEDKQRWLEKFSRLERLQWLVKLLKTELDERMLSKLLRARVERYASTFYPKWKAILALYHIREGRAKQYKTLSDLAGHKLKDFDGFLPFINSPDVQKEIKETLNDPEFRRMLDEQITISAQERVSYVHEHLMKKIGLAIISLFHESGIGFQQDLREAAGQPPVPSKQLAKLADNEIRAVKHRLGVKRGRHRDTPEEALRKLIGEKNDFIEKVKAVKEELRNKGKKVTKTAVAQKLGYGGINEKGTDTRIQVFNRKLKRYGLEFKDI